MKRKEDVIVMDYRHRGHPSSTRKKLEAAAKRAKPNPRPTVECVMALRARIAELEAENEELRKDLWSMYGQYLDERNKE